MHPILIELGSFPIHTYGVLVALGFFTGLFVIRYHAKKLKMDIEKVTDYCFLALLVGFIGCRILFVITQYQYFLEKPLEIFYFWEGGLVFYGGPLFAVPWTFWYAKKHKLFLPDLADIAVTGLTLGHAIGRLGCIAAGCCFGKPCPYPWGIRLHSELVDVHLRGLPLHPTPLYESALLFSLFAFLIWKIRKRKFSGQIATLYFILYAIIRFIVEIYRGDEIRGVFFQTISTSQVISVVALVAGSAFYYVLQKKKSSTAG